MPATLTKDNANRITKVDNGNVVVIPNGVFTQGDMLILFNNSDSFITLESKVERTYKSGTSWTRKIVEWPPRTIVNVIFVENDLVVISVGIT